MFTRRFLVKEGVWEMFSGVGVCVEHADARTVREAEGLNPMENRSAWCHFSTKERIMQGKIQRLLLLGLAACVVAVMGCGGPPTLSTEYVEGVVTLDGQPVAEATVTFVPVTEGQGAPATGMTNQQGVYKLTATVTGELAATPEAGTLPGEYFVGVMKNVVETRMSQEEAEQAGVEYVPAAEEAAPKITFVVPQKYNVPRESGIKVTVQAGTNNLPIELTSN